MVEDILGPTELAIVEPEAGMSLQELFQADAVQSVPSGYGDIPDHLPSEDVTLASLQNDGGLTIADSQAHKATFDQTEPDRQANEEPAQDKQPAQPSQGPGLDNDTPDFMA